jgi:hypothetical protein
LNETSVSIYLFRSKLTGAGRNEVGGAPKFFNYVAADYIATIFWHFIDIDIYYNPQFAYCLKIGMLCVNIFHFFIKKNAFPRCFKNLLETFDSNKGKSLGVNCQSDVQNICEMLLIGFISGVVLMPGAH